MFKNYQKQEGEFKKEFEKITQAMVSLALEYVNNDIENVKAIYIFCSNEEDFIFFNTFFNIDNELLKKHRINDTGREYNSSKEIQVRFSKYGTSDLRKLVNLFKEYKKDVPTLIKMEYYPRNGKFDCSIDYKSQYSNKRGGSPDEVAEAWFQELKSNPPSI